MRSWGMTGVLDERERAAIHGGILRILDRVGLSVDNDAILDRLKSFGARVDPAERRARFPPRFVEDFLASSERVDYDKITPQVGGSAGIYFGYYLDPDTNRHEPWSIETLLRYLKTAHYLENVSKTLSVSLSVQGVPNSAAVPFVHYMAFKFLGRGACALDEPRWCPVVLEMCEAFAADKGCRVEDVFSGYVHLISPLKFGAEEARIFAFFAERGLRVPIGAMTSAGGSAPVTLAGAVTLHLAQVLAINIVHRAFFGDKRIEMGAVISPLDMRTAMYPYGRPEKALCNVAIAAMARHYGASFGAHCGQSDAKRPSAEAGFQKALTAIPTLLASGTTRICCGLLSVDEVFSPVQMVIDNDIVGALRRYARGFEVNDETLALDLIESIGPGGQFMDADHTARHFREEFWEPRVFARDMFPAWRNAGSITDADAAVAIFHDIQRRDPLPTHISPAAEKCVLDIARRSSGVELRPVEPL